ncbi:MAG: DUF6529 family protein [Candidatus Brocadia sp.]|nr:DUF6529 family protein [Candidatus Brocadia sp.]
MEIIFKKFIDCLKFFPEKSYINSVLAFSLLIVGIIAVILILTVLGKVNPPKHPKFFISAHRICGYIFFAFYLFICSIMFQKLMGFSMLPPKATIHAYIGITVFPMILAKIFIVRFYRKFYNSLPIFGMIIIIATYLQIPLYAGLDIFTSMKNSEAVLTENERFVWMDNNSDQNIATWKYSFCLSPGSDLPYVKAEVCLDNYTPCIRSKNPGVSDDSEILPAGYSVKNQSICDGGETDRKIDEWTQKWE